jgi:TonB family protein
MAGFDSVVRARSDAGREVSEAFPIQPPPLMAVAPQRGSFIRDDQVTAPQRAQLIGTLPTPRVPAPVADVQGDVRVRFEVDSTGRPVMSSLSVVNSPNSILTAAVVKLIPGLRFEPARSGGANAKPIADVVQLGFNFRPTK